MVFKQCNMIATDVWCELEMIMWLLMTIHNFEKYLDIMVTDGTDCIYDGLW